MKSIYSFAFLCSLFLFNTLTAQVSFDFDFAISANNGVSIESPTVCQGFPLEVCGSYTLDTNFPLTVESVEAIGLNYTLLSFDEVNQTFCMSISEDNYATSDCRDIAVLLTLTDQAGNEVFLTSNAVSFCLDQITCACLYYELDNVLCYNNGTSDFEDDYWSFDIVVYNNIDSNSSWIAEPLGITGIYGVSQTVIVGFIIDFDSIKLTIQDANFPDDCDEIKVEVAAPESCSSGCDFFVSAEVGECNDGDTPDNLSDDVYDVKVNVTSGSVDQWEVYRTYVNDNTSELIGAGVGNQQIDLPMEGIIYGDWVLSGYILNDPECQSVDFVDAPEFCSGCMEVIVNNILCDDQGTASDLDDTWTFDVQVLGGTGEEFRILEYGIQEYYGTVVTVEAGLIANCLEIMIADVTNPMECNSNFIVCPPETCSEDTNCPLLVEIGKFDCVKIGNDPGFEMSMQVQNTFGACWRAIKTNANGSTEVLVEGEGDKVLKLGPFSVDADFTLHVELCDNPSCVVSFEIVAPDCPTLKNNDFDLRNRELTRIYPNPVSANVFQIEFATDVMTYYIYDAAGRIVQPEGMSDESVMLQLDLRPGVYFLFTKNIQGEIDQQKFIKL
ncbi:T9SS type A sorting domain-containing protein [Saprospiraceae bacterium]|nr:T9SS type A sorting domain-containing protein [Saprospiraceae bacterium]